MRRIKYIALGAPVIIDGELKLRSLRNISYAAIKEAYHLLGTVPPLEIHQNKETRAILAGVPRQGDIAIEFDIHFCLDFKSKPTLKAIPQLPKFMQVAMVSINEPRSRQGFSRGIYSFIAQKMNLVSDQSQYPLAKKLWKSLARESNVNIYVYDSNIGDYIRHEGKIVRYNSKNLDDSKIWSGHNMFYEDVLLVATTKDIT